MREKLLTGTVRVMLTLMTIAVCGAGNLAIAEDGNDKGKCDLRGSWTGSFLTGVPGLGKFMVTYEGASDKSGTDDVDGVSMVPGLLGIHPNASLSSARGVWERIGKRKFAYTLLVYGVDPASGLVMESVRMFGVKTLSADCNSMEVSVGLKLFVGPDEDPTSENSGIPILELDPNAVLGTATRIRLDTDSLPNAE